MHDEERGMIKWAPFASVVDPNYLVNKIVEEKNKIEKPILTEDAICIIESDIKYSLECKCKIKIYYYKNGRILNINEIVLSLDFYNKKIFLSNNKSIYFESIIKTAR